MQSLNAGRVQREVTEVVTSKAMPGAAFSYTPGPVSQGIEVDERTAREAGSTALSLRAFAAVTGLQ